MDFEVIKTPRRARKQLEVFRASLDEVSFVDLSLLVDELVVEALRDRNGSTGEPIELRAERAGDRVRVAIAEGGRGFPASVEAPRARRSRLRDAPRSAAERPLGRAPRSESRGRLARDAPGPSQGRRVIRRGSISA